MLAVTMMNYNFCRPHSTLKTTPAVAADVTNHRWTLEEVVLMIDAYIRAKLDAEFARAFETANLTPQRTQSKDLRANAQRSDSDALVSERI
jgi:hypothetical protein